jgi:transcriptional regulator with XRE-family HTH domain
VQTIRTKRHRKLIKLLIAAREAAGMKQADLARQYKQHQSWVARLESGQRRLDVYEFLLLADIIGFDPAQMINKVRKVEADEIVGPRWRPRRRSRAR